MANNVQFQSSVPSTPSSATLVQTVQQADTSQRQVVSIGDFWGSSAGSLSVTPSSAVTTTFLGTPAVTVTSGTITLSSNPTVVLSSAPAFAISSAIAISSGTVTLSSNPTVILSSNPTITSVSSGAVTIINGANTANVMAASSLPTSTMSALLVAISPNGVNPNGQAASSNSAPVVISSNQTAIAVSFSSGTVTLSSNPTVIPSSAFQVTLTSNVVVLSSNPTVIPSSVVSITPSSVLAVMLSSLGWGGTNSSLSTPTVPADQYGAYTTVAAGQTQQALGSSAGRAGDYLAYLTVFPAVAACGAVTIFDSTGVTWGSFAGGGTTALPSLVPFRIDVGAYSVSSGWKVTTGSSVSATGVGKFT